MQQRHFLILNPPASLAARQQGVCGHFRADSGGIQDTCFQRVGEACTISDSNPRIFLAKTLAL
jgi:hypothetical protein